MALTITYPEALPVSARRDDIMAAIRENQVVVVAGETGSGKTTQLPKMLLELGLDAEVKGRDGKPRRLVIGHTQPRRLAARTVAERIAEELGVQIGQEVGFQVRFTGEVSSETRVKLMTDGILLAEIQHDKLLSRYGAIIIDEAHERSLNIDVLLGHLKRILPERPDLKVVITSATIDPDRFARHFGTPASAPGHAPSGTAVPAHADDVAPKDDGVVELPANEIQVRENGTTVTHVRPAPVIEVSGRTFPVEIRYRPLSPDDEDGGDELEPGASGQDRDMVDAVCDAVVELSREADGDILIFFSGEREIRDAAEALRGLTPRHPRLRDAEVLPLFARLSLAEQHAVFRPGAKRRIVLATNVAETSLTVPGIKYVIDTGVARISRYSHRTKVQRLPIEAISQASANQRSGRCGRVSDGIAIRLYSEEDFASRPEFTDPEILRTNLASVILQMSSMGVVAHPADVVNFPFVEPPESRAVNDGITLLRELGAVGEGKRGAITKTGRELSQLPVDVRLGRMILEAGRRECATEVLVLAAGLSLQDPRERPTEESGKRQRAQELHARFVDKDSDFTGYLNLWRYLQEQQEELSSSAFRRLCKSEFINYLRVREWQDLFNQLRQIVKPLRMRVPGREVDPVGKHDAVHQSLLSGLVSHIGLWDERKREYAGARGTRFAIFPGSALFKKKPTWAMAAELVETSRLWARTVASFDPDWVEQVAPHLVKKSFSEPHWSRRQGACLAHEKVTVFGVPVVADRVIQLSRINPRLARELFIRHALVEGDWQTRHAFFARNRDRLKEIDELEARLRRRDLRASDEDLFDFYDARLPQDVTDERSFDAWWKKERSVNGWLLDFDPEELLQADADELDSDAYPRTWNHGSLQLELRYEFDPTGATADGVFVRVPVLFLNQLDTERFRWGVPGLREELVTALIKSLPKAVRKSFVPAPDVARQAVAALAEDADPSTDDLLPALELVLRRLKGLVIPPGSWDLSRIPDHLRPSFEVIGERGKVLGASRDLATLQAKLAGENRRAIAASLGTSAEKLNAAAGKPGAPKHDGGRPGSPAGTGGRGAGNGARGTGGAQGGRDVVQGKPGSGKQATNPWHRTGLTSWPDDLGEHGKLPEKVVTTVKGQQITAYPGLVDRGESVDLTVFRNPAEQAAAHRKGVIRLLQLTVPSPQRYVLDHLNNKEKLAFSQSPHGTVESLIRDCTWAGIDKLLPPVLPMMKSEFTSLFHLVRAEIIDTVFSVASTVEKVLASSVRITNKLSGMSGEALKDTVEDVRSQMRGLVYPGFVASTGYAQLAHLPRYLTAVERRLDKVIAGALTKDLQGLDIIQELEDEYDAALDRTPAGAAHPAKLLPVKWMLEEQRVSLFAQELGTAYSVSPKRIRAAIKEGLTG
ncbi:ATP-dependent RNA helicase HrpA [Galactobacter valiniphilus]|uniref:ATP-dependent RNA helicase HrpA n=1 Tax=Galactobacter valiniphilus TaxID=2676122 RepID=A0A399JDD9_9MICC|nr:ATP-dependent RNA helicase HrpA [Galactobacter valiniphilus]RII43050.1 ATP-dependent RNA helicase HrpA [Galactobacter valiniphilus]